MKASQHTITDDALTSAFKEKLREHFKGHIRQVIEPLVLEFSENMINTLDVKAQIYKDMTDLMTVIRATYKIPENAEKGIWK